MTWPRSVKSWPTPCFSMTRWALATMLLKIAAAFARLARRGGAPADPIACGLPVWLPAPVAKPGIND